MPPEMTSRNNGICTIVSAVAKRLTIFCRRFCSSSLEECASVWGSHCAEYYYKPVVQIYFFGSQHLAAENLHQSVPSTNTPALIHIERPSNSDNQTMQL